MNTKATGQKRAIAHFIHWIARKNKLDIRTIFMRKIKLISIEFGEIPFRKLKGFKLPIAKRITVIAGHNGIGKSTILGLLANASGISSRDHLSYFGRTFKADFQQIFTLSIAHDYVEDPDKKPYAEICYDVSGKNVTKKCNTSLRTTAKATATTKAKQELRVVPRNEPKAVVEQDGIIVPQDGKVPVPTIYLGMSRMIPTGESLPEDVQTTRDKKIAEEDAKYIAQVVGSLIDTGGSKNDHTITDQSIKHTRKTSKHPPYAYDSRSISLGQDSVSAIVTALASFHKIKREMGDAYPGGVLIIDEVDAGFHPRTQLDLIDKLQKEARDLDLQIIVTTHSLTVVEKVLTAKRGPHSSWDHVAYLRDTLRPRLSMDLTLEQVRDDMHLTPPTKQKQSRRAVKLYTEDDEAKYVLEQILDRATKARIQRETGFSVKIVSVKLGYVTLLALHKSDDYFSKSVVCVLDADSPVSAARNHNNIVKLPSDTRFNVKQAPEAIIHEFCRALREHPDQHPAADQVLQNKGITSDYIKRNLLDDSVDFQKRDPAKQWWKDKFADIKRIGLVKLWANDNGPATESFLTKLIDTVKSVGTAPR